MTNKMTKKDWFTALMNVVENSNVENKEDMKAFINHEIELLNRKRKTTSTPIQEENAKIKETIKTVLSESEKPMTIGDMMKDARLEAYGNQKLTALVRQLKLADEVVRTEIKRRAYFSLKEE